MPLATSQSAHKKITTTLVTQALWLIIIFINNIIPIITSKKMEPDLLFYVWISLTYFVWQHHPFWKHDKRQQIHIPIWMFCNSNIKNGWHFLPLILKLYAPRGKACLLKFYLLMFLSKGCVDGVSRNEFSITSNGWWTIDNSIVFYSTIFFFRKQLFQIMGGGSLLQPILRSFNFLSTLNACEAMLFRPLFYLLHQHFLKKFITPFLKACIQWWELGTDGKMRISL